MDKVGSEAIARRDKTQLRGFPFLHQFLRLGIRVLGLTFAFLDTCVVSSVNFSRSGDKGITTHRAAGGGGEGAEGLLPTKPSSRPQVTYLLVSALGPSTGSSRILFIFIFISFHAV